MSAWGSGYVTDIPYTTGWYRQQSPSIMALACLLCGVAASMPAADDAVSYLELGCGHGFGALVLAGQRQRQVVARHARGRIQFHGRTEFLGGFGFALLHQQVVAEIVVQRVVGRSQFHSPPMMRLAEGVFVALVAQNAEPGKIFRRRPRVDLEKALQAGDRLGRLVQLVQLTHQGQLHGAGIREASRGEAHDFEGHVGIAAGGVGPGQIETRRHVIGLGRDLLAEFAQLQIAIAGVARVADLPFENGLASRRGCGRSLRNDVPAGARRCGQRQ